MILIERYRSGDGAEPFTEWFGSLKDATVRARVLARLDRVSAGNFGHCKALRNGVWELRLDVGPGYRVYYGMAGKSFLLLLTGGSKRTQDADIARAVGYWDDYLGRVK